jgi:hypothetical protein
MARLRISGAVPLLPLCAFMAWEKTTLPLISVALPVKKRATLWNPVFNYRVYKSKPLGLIRRQLNPVNLIVPSSLMYKLSRSIENSFHLKANKFCKNIPSGIECCLM